MVVFAVHVSKTCQAMPPKVCPKLPIKLVTDPSVGGALHAIALKVYDIRRQRGLKAIEWQNPGKRKEVCLQREKRMAYCGYMITAQHTSWVTRESCIAFQLAWKAYMLAWTLRRCATPVCCP
jgi:hypothetical protein